MSSGGPRQDPAYVDARDAWKAAHLAPLWESAVSHRPDAAAEPSAIWRWSQVRPLLSKAIDLVSPADVERRVLNFSNPHAPQVSGRAPTTRIISAGLQILLPGEVARPHRHSIDALRFVMEGEGAVTIVNGKECPMRVGDLVLTPGWTWHEHVHRGTAPIIWLDVLNGAMHRFLGTASFEAGPPNAPPTALPDAAFATAAMVPDVGDDMPSASPLFIYPYRKVVAALTDAPAAADGARHVRYVNPFSGAPAVPLMDTRMVELPSDRPTRGYVTCASAVCAVVDGEGETTVGDQTFAWSKNDFFTLPAGQRITHLAGPKSTRLFIVSDREVFRRLGLLKETWAD